MTPTWYSAGEAPAGIHHYPVIITWEEVPGIITFNIPPLQIWVVI